MIVSIENLGVIRKADIDLRQSLTILCGRNNTGKTYLSYLVYASADTKLLKREGGFSEEQIKALYGGESIDCEISIEEVNAYLKELSNFIRSNTDSIFGISEEDSKAYFDKLSVSISPIDEPSFRSMKFSYTREIDGLRFLIEKESEKSAIKITPSTENNYTRTSIPLFVMLYSDLVNTLAKYPMLRAAIFPVERNSIYTFKTELSIGRNTLIDQIQKIGRNEEINPLDFLEQHARRYPQAVRDCLRSANDLTELQKQKGYYYDMACELEQRLLEGTLTINKEGDVVYNSQRMGKRKQLAISMTASIVKTLSSLIIYLKHQAVRGELIIIDEPEMNLHPSAQIGIARFFAELVNAGLRLVVSTHSDYIIREVNNMIMLGALRERTNLSEDVDYPESQFLKAEQTACYYFSFKGKSAKTVQVSAIPCTETGYAVPSIDDAIENQNANYEALYTQTIYGHD